MFARTTDGGLTWSTPEPMRDSNAFFQGNEIAVGPDVQSYDHANDVPDTGMVTLTYFDDRNNVPRDGVATTDVWVRHSRDGAATGNPNSTSMAGSTTKTR